MISLNSCFKIKSSPEFWYPTQQLFFPSHVCAFGHRFKPPGTVHGDEINDTPPPCFCRGAVLLHCPVELPQMGVSTWKGIWEAQMCHDSQGQRCSKYHTSSAGPNTAVCKCCTHLSRLHPQPLKAPSGCVWATGSYHPPGLLPCGHLQDCTPRWLCVTLAKQETEAAVQPSLVEDIHNISLACVYPFRGDSTAPRQP